MFDHSEYYKEHRDEKLQYQKDYYKERRDEKIEYQKDYYKY